jgi:hypothetical protein
MNSYPDLSFSGIGIYIECGTSGCVAMSRGAAVDECLDTLVCGFNGILCEACTKGMT